MQKQYDANLNFFTDTTFTPKDALAETVTNTIELQNAGGLTSWQAGWGYRFKNRMSVGLIYERIFFNSESRNTFESSFAYHDGITFTSSIRETKISSFSSNGVRFGLQIPVHEKVTAGVSAQYVLYADKTGSLTREYQRSDENTPHEESTEKFSVHIPPSVSAGLCYEPNNKWLFAFDVHSTIWERYDSGLGTPDDLRTTYGAALGTSFTPAVNRLGAKYWETIRYRAGMNYSQLPLEKSQEYMFTLGTGLPIPNDGGLVDVIFGFGGRSSKKYSGYSEYVTKLELGINGGRSWFQKTAARNY
jgi:long-subunit fatty acid transport protein